MAETFRTSNAVGQAKTPLRGNSLGPSFFVAALERRAPERVDRRLAPALPLQRQADAQPQPVRFAFFGGVPIPQRLDIATHDPQPDTVMHGWIVAAGRLGPRGKIAVEDPRQIGATHARPFI